MADLSRRAVLRLGLAVGLPGVTLSGCALSDPTIDRPGPDLPVRQPPSKSSSSPSPTGTPAPTGAQLAVVRESALSRTAAVLGKRTGVKKDQRALLADLSAAHRSHAQTLLAASELTPSPPKNPSRGAVKDELKGLVRAEKAAAQRYRSEAQKARGTQALLWSSLAVSSGNFATALSAAETPTMAKIDSPRPVTVLSDIETAQAIVSQLHALVYGYQLAIGNLPEGKPARERAVTQLKQYRTTRDVEITWLIKRSAKVPVAEPAYVPSVNPTDARSSAKLIMKMLLALQPFCGLAVAGAGNDQDRQRAFDLLEQTVARARGWGAPVNAWPGYTV